MKDQIRPTLYAFPITWAYVIAMTATIIKVEYTEASLGLGLVLAAMVFYMLQYTWARTYTIKDKQLIFYNRLGGKRQVINLSHIVNTRQKPIWLNVGHFELRLRNGYPFTLRNIKLDSEVVKQLVGAAV
ncbi:hypothetical protein [Bermanella sp. R86510]|uniref:hypothetical protein n=1 Tax=unclassified Bermanella TaxID=2627862 RepID=UPI0037C8156D